MELLKLCEHNRKASLGYEYFYLKSIYPNWADDLHTFGNILENDKLETIGINGLVFWYIKNTCPIPVKYNFNNLEFFINNTKIITYYDFINILKLLKYLHIEIDEIKKYNFKFETKCRFLNIIYKHKKRNISKYYVNPFGYFLNDIIGEEKINKIIINCNNFIKSNHFWFEKNNIFDTFIYKNQVIKLWVIIFQKFKVIVEKMSYKNHKDVFKIDTFVENIQQLIYSLCIHYINNFIVNDTNSIYINHPIIKCLENKELLSVFKDFDKCIHLVKI